MTQAQKEAVLQLLGQANKARPNPTGHGPDQAFQAGWNQCMTTIVMFLHLPQEEPEIAATPTTPHRTPPHRTKD